MGKKGEAAETYTPDALVVHTVRGRADLHVPRSEGQVGVGVGGW